MVDGPQSTGCAKRSAHIIRLQGGCLQQLAATTVAYQLDGKRTYALEGVCYQTNDLLEAMKRDWGTRGETILRVDGG